MIELLPGSNALTDSSDVERFLAKALPAGRFRWYEDCGIHALIFTGDPKGNLYNIKVEDPMSRQFFKHPRAGKQVQVQNYHLLRDVRMIYENLEEMRESSLAEIARGLISLDQIREECSLFEIGLPYQIGNRFASDIITFRRQ